MTMKTEARLEALNIKLPIAPNPVGNYLPYRISGHLLFLAGSICMVNGEMVHTGAVGSDVDEKTGILAARLCAMNQLSILKSALGDLDRIVKMVSLAGFVWSVPGYTQAPKIINGASDFFVEVLEEKGRHSRTAVSVCGLPAGSTVEIQSVWEFK